MDWDTLQTLVIDWIGIITFIGGVALWYRGAVEKKYAAQRDFGHLKRNYENLSMTVLEQGKDIDRRFDGLEADTREVKILLQVLVSRTGDDSISGILNR